MGWRRHTQDLCGSTLQDLRRAPNPDFSWGFPLRVLYCRAFTRPSQGLELQGLGFESAERA